MFLLIAAIYFLLLHFHGWVWCLSTLLKVLCLFIIVVTPQFTVKISPSSLGCRSTSVTYTNRDKQLSCTYSHTRVRTTQGCAAGVNERKEFGFSWSGWLKI